MAIGFRELLLYRLVLRGQEDDLAVRRLGHRLHGFEISDLHGWCAGQDVGGLTHEFRGFDLGTRADDLGLTGPLGLRGHGQAVLELLAEDDILDKHALHRRTPSRRSLLDDLTNRLRDLLATLDHVLQHARADDVAQRGLCPLDERLSQVGDAECGLVRARDMIVDDGREGEVDVVFGHADLFRNFDDLNLDVDLNERFGQRVDFDETRVDCAREATELGDQPDLALRDGLVWVGADDAAWDGSQGTDAPAESVDHVWW